MKETIKINDVELTRAQLEDAMKRINFPDQPPVRIPEIGEIGHVRRGARLGESDALMVISDRITDNLAEVDMATTNVVYITTGRYTFHMNAADWIPGPRP